MKYRPREPKGTRPQGGGSKPKQWPQKTVLLVHRLYRQGLTQKEVGQRLTLSYKQVCVIMREYHIPADPFRRIERVRLNRGPNHYAWKGLLASPRNQRRRV